MAFKDQQNLSKVEILFYKSNSYFFELRTCLNILIWILQVGKLLLCGSTYVTIHVIIEHRQIILPPPSKQGDVASKEIAQFTRILETHFFKVLLDVAPSPVHGPWSLMQ